MRYKDLETNLKKTFISVSQNVTPPEDMLERIEKGIELRKNDCNYKKERVVMTKKFKIGIAAAAICLFSVSAYAVGNISGYHSGTTNENIAYSQIVNFEKETGIDIKSVEKFDNGFEYSRAGKGETTAVDDNGATVGKSKEITISYKNKNGKPLTLSARNIIAGENIKEDYGILKMVCYPGNSEGKVDEAELADYRAKGYEISYGTDEKEENIFENITWIDGNMVYSLGTIDSNFDNILGEDEFNKMKQVIMDAE